MGWESNLSGPMGWMSGSGPVNRYWAHRLPSPPCMPEQTMLHPLQDLCCMWYPLPIPTPAPSAVLLHCTHHPLQAVWDSYCMCWPWLPHVFHWLGEACKVQILDQLEWTPHAAQIPDWEVQGASWTLGTNPVWYIGQLRPRDSIGGHMTGLHGMDPVYGHTFDTSIIMDR